MNNFVFWSIIIVVGLLIVLPIIGWIFSSDEPPVSNVNDFKYERKGWINSISICRNTTNATQCLNMRNTVAMENVTMY